VRANIQSLKQKNKRYCAITITLNALATPTAAYDNLAADSASLATQRTSALRTMNVTDFTTCSTGAQWRQRQSDLPDAIGLGRDGGCAILPGYCLLLPDPVVPSLNDLDAEARAAYLLDMGRLGDAVLQATDALRMNYENPRQLGTGTALPPVPALRLGTARETQNARVVLRLEKRSALRRGRAWPTADPHCAFAKRREPIAEHLRQTTVARELAPAVSRSGTFFIC
jgi:hypothetical protein